MKPYLVTLCLLFGATVLRADPVCLSPATDRVASSEPRASAKTKSDKNTKPAAPTPPTTPPAPAPRRELPAPPAHLFM